jgi:DNA polymerase-1
MIRVHDRLLLEHFTARLILQVHDELLVEAPKEEKERVIALLEEEMRGAVSLLVDMEVGTATGSNWYEAH